MSPRPISRRTVLRGMLAGGISVTVALPRLAGMLNGNGTAYAQGAPLPLRFGTWFFGNGIIPDRWVPSSTGQGDAWQLSEQLAPLAEVKPWLSVLTGLSIKVPNNSPHASHPCAALTGAQTGAGQVRLASIDQLIAPAIGGGTAYPTGIHAGLSNQTGATALGLAVSYRGPNAANPPTYNPTALYQELLGFTSDGTPAAADPELSYRQSVWFTLHDVAKIGKITPAGEITEYYVPSGNRPGRIITGPDNNLWFTLSAANGIGRITPLGQVSEYAIPTRASDPYDITVGPEQNLWFTGLSSNKIGRISGLTGGGMVVASEGGVRGQEFGGDTACSKDTDCIESGRACGGDVCGVQGVCVLAVSDDPGTCTSDAECWCQNRGATCENAHCSFVVPGGE